MLEIGKHGSVRGSLDTPYNQRKGCRAPTRLIFINIKYKNNQLEECIEDLFDIKSSQRILIKKIGVDISIALRRRITQILSFSCFSSFIDAHIDNTEALKGDMKGYYSMTLTRNYRVIISPNTEVQTKESLKDIQDFILIGVIDYHGEGKKDNKWLIK